MWEELLAFFVAVWRADDSPGARRFTIGCGIIVFLIVGAIAFYYSTR